MIYIKKLTTIFFLFVLSSCLPSNTEDATIILPTAEPRPAFILNVAPLESQILPISMFEADRIGPGLAADIWDEIDGYNSQVCLKIETGLLAQTGDDFIEPSSIKERVAISVDGFRMKETFVNSILLQSIHVKDINGQYLMKGVEPKLICSPVEIGEGVHDVLFQFRQTSGDVLEYQWHFALKDE